MTQRGFDITVPEMLAQAKPDRKVEYQINVRPRLPSRRNNGRT